MCVAVDSDCMVAMQIERVSDQLGPATEALDRILANSYIALDDGGLCQQEWCGCMPGPFGEEVKSWIDQLIVEQQIRLLPIGTPANLFKACRLMGLPKEDFKWVRLCSHDCVQIFLTEDIDFFDPCQKKSDGKTRQKTKSNLAGAMRKLIKKETGVEVICFEHVPDFVI